MSTAATKSDALLQRLSNQQRRQTLRKNVYLLFLGLSPAEADPIISLLRGARLAPRGRQVDSEQALLEALSERSWDLIICTSEQEEINIKQAMLHLKRLDKDIPVVQLVPHADSRYLLQGLKANMQAVVPLEEKELLLISIRRELEHLENRRRMRQAEVFLKESEKRCRQLEQHSTLAIAYFDANGLLQGNPTFAELFGYEDADKLPGKTLSQFILTEDQPALGQAIAELAETGKKQQLKLTAQRTDQSNFSTDVELQDAKLNDKHCMQVIIHANAKQAPQTFSENDPITGLYNGEFFLRRLDETITAALGGGHDCQLMYIELDSHSALKSKYGADMCDHVARDFADLLKTQFNPVHIKGRLDESAYVVIFHDPSADKAIEMAEKLCRNFAQHTSVMGQHKVRLTCSVGIAAVTDTSPDSPELIERARSTAHQLRHDGNKGNGVLLYTAEQHHDDNESLEAIQALRHAVENQQFKLLFQPVVPLSYTSNMTHYEVLLRLLDEDNSEITPALFMNMIEAADLCIQMDRWVIEQAVQQLRIELEKGNKHRLFISVTSRTWRDPELLVWLAALLREQRMPAAHLVFQISENECSSNLSAARSFAQGLKKLNCLICIKHHGCSSNSRQIMGKIPADYIKLDGSFIHELAEADPLDESFNELIENLKAQGKITIAPQVETPQVMSRLWKSGVGLIQGYYLQPPVPQMNYAFFDE